MSDIDFSRIKIVIIKDSCDALAQEVMELEESELNEAAYDRLTWPMLFDHGLVMALRYDDETIGLAAFVRDWHEDDLAYLASFAIRGDFSKQGLGTFLLDEALKLLEYKSMTRVLLTVSPDNAGAISLYKKSGFIDDGFVKDKYGEGHDRLMFKYKSPESRVESGETHNDR